MDKISGHAKANCFWRFLDDHDIHYLYHFRHELSKNCEHSKQMYERISYLFSEPIITCKHLVLQERKGDKKIFLIIVNSDLGNLDLKELKNCLNVGKLEFVNSNVLQELFYTFPGNVSIFQSVYDRYGQVQVIIDDSVQPSDILAFHPLYSGDTIFLTLSETLKYMDFIEHSYQFLQVPRKDSIKLERVL